MTESAIELRLAYSSDSDTKSLRERLLKMSFIANRKNRVMETQLKAELNRISKQAKNDLKMYRNEQQRFKNKYAKYDPFNDKRGSDASDVRMYETHIPGFCYRRDGASRIPNPGTNRGSVDFQDLHDMLFTDSEVDIEKLLVLHLLSTHKTDSLQAPPKAYNLFLSREQSPLERLVERSKKKSLTLRISRLLPTYVLDVETEGNPELKEFIVKEPVRDQRLGGKFIINDKLVELCVTVMNALQKSNVKKMNEFIEMSRSPEKLRSIISKPELQEFIRRLSGLNLISSCESFLLVVPQKMAVISIKVSTQTGLFEKLLLQIRKNIFQVPSVDSWSLALSESISDTIDEVKAPAENFIRPKVDHILGRTSDRKSISSFRESQGSIMSSKRRPSKYEQEDIEFDNYIAKATKQLNRSPLYTPPQKNKKKNSTDSDEGSYHANNAVTPIFESEEFGLGNLSVDSMPTTDKESEDHNLHRRNTNCVACMEKWKQPLPKPRASTIQKNMPMLTDADVEITDSLYKLSGLVDRNKNKLQYYEKRFSKDRENRQSLSKMRGSVTSHGSKKSSVEIVDLDRLDLAKIRLEIRENETKKKVDNFIKRQQMNQQNANAKANENKPK